MAYDIVPTDTQASTLAASASQPTPTGSAGQYGGGGGGEGAPTLDGVMYMLEHLMKGQEDLRTQFQRRVNIEDDKFRAMRSRYTKLSAVVNRIDHSVARIGTSLAELLAKMFGAHDADDDESGSNDKSDDDGGDEPSDY